MLNLTDEQKQVFRKESTHKKLKITFLTADYKDITNERIYTESLTINESICDNENLKFGECESAEMTIQVADVPLEIKNHEVQLTLTIEDVEISLGVFFIADVEKATGMRYKKLKCYDRIYLFGINVIDWYNTLYSTVETTHTLKEFRDSFFEYMGIEQEEISLPNDNMVIKKTIDSNEINGLNVIKAICEINGCFGHMSRNGKFRYVYLEQNAIYPSETLYPSEKLYPGGGERESILGSMYIPPCERADYSVKAINKLQIRGEQDDIGAIVTAEGYTDDNNNSYIITGNFLAYGQTSEQLEVIARNISTKVFGITYVPHKTFLPALPYIEVGDGFYLSAFKDPFSSFVLKRTISGIQGMKDEWEADGEETQPEISTSSNQQIIQLQSRVNKLSMTVDGFNAEISSINSTLEEVPTRTEMTTAINASAEGLNIEISKKVNEDSIIASINASAEQISINASKINLTGYVTFNNLTDATTIISGDNIRTGTISAERINGNNLKITGSEAVVQIGAEGVGNDNYIYMVSTTESKFSYFDPGIIAVVSVQGAFSATGDGGIVYTYDNENCFTFNCIDDKATISTAKDEMVITAPKIELNNIVSYGTYSFISGAEISYNGATDRVEINKGIYATQVVADTGDVNNFGILGSLICNTALFNGKVNADKFEAYVTGVGWYTLSDLLKDLMQRTGMLS